MAKTKTELLEFVNTKITNYGQSIVDRGDRADSSALGELTFYISLRNMLHKGDEASELFERGMMDAVFDTLKFMELVTNTEKKTFLSLVSQ